MKFMIGQRVIIYDNVVGNVVKPERKDLPNTDAQVWIYNPEKGYASYYSVDNVKPLPDGQL